MNKIKWNTFTAIILQMVILVYGFVLPRLILKTYGSEVNGLINSITQFLALISLMEMGVGTVVQSALYRPLACNDKIQINKIMTSAKKFFRRLSYILCLYVLILLIGYPRFINKSFDIEYIVSLIIILSVSTFIEYYFGLVNGLLLIADQKGYVYYGAQIVTQLLCLICCPILIQKGCSIQILKFSTMLIGIMKPIFLTIYVYKYYHINYCEEYESEPIPQKWNGIAQHFAAIVLDNTDIVVLTAFASLREVSIYSVYYLVIGGIRRVLLMVFQSFQPYFGNLWINNRKSLQNFFEQFEWAVHCIIVTVFLSTAFLVVPFIKIYTAGVNDAEYIQPIFAILLTLAQAFRCLRTPYNMAIFAAGHYKQTQNSYFIVCAINIFVSLIMIHKYGLVGIALGTLLAMAYHTGWMMFYVSRNLLVLKMKRQIKLYIVDILVVVIAFVIKRMIGDEGECDTYFQWFRMAVFISIRLIFLEVVVNVIFYYVWGKWLVKKVKMER